MNIEEAREIINEILSDEFLLTAFNQDSSFESRQIKANAIETLLTAYEKEKEENKQIKCKLDEKNIPIETLLAEFERLEDLEDDLTTVYLNGVYDGEKKVQDKIKAKIEEINKEMLNEENSLELFYRKKYCKEVLQSLLKEE